MTAALGFWSIAEEDPHRLAVVDPEGHRTSFGELADLTNRYTHGLRACAASAPATGSSWSCRTGWT